MRYDARWGAPGRRKAKKALWERRRQWSRAAEPVHDENETFQSVAPEEVPNEVPEKLTTSQQYKRDARVLWGSPLDYVNNIHRDRERDPQLYAVTHAVFHVQAAKSTYRARLKDPRLIELYDAKANKQVRDAYDVLLRRKSVAIIPFTTWCRSLSYFNQRTPTRVWNDQQAGLRIGAALTVDTCFPCLQLPLATAQFTKIPSRRCSKP